jgi:hypothetical protein
MYPGLAISSRDAGRVGVCGALAGARHRRQHRIFSLVNGLLLRALPVKEPAQLALITDDQERGARSRGCPRDRRLAAGVSRLAH